MFAVWEEILQIMKIGIINMKSYTSSTIIDFFTSLPLWYITWNTSMDPIKIIKHVLKMGNISYFHLEHSNCYLFYIFKFRNPFISKKKSSDYRVYGTSFNPLFQRKNRVWKICTETWDIAKKVRFFLTLCFV